MTEPRRSDEPGNGFADQVRHRLLGLADRAEQTSSAGQVWGNVTTWFSTFVNPQYESHLLHEERVISKVRHHWIVYVVPWLAIGSAVLGGLVWYLASPVNASWVPALLAAIIAGWGGWRLLDHHMDLFIITDRKVFRVRGIINQRYAWTPVSRLLDITVLHPPMGRIFGYGHIVLENAAQEQGLRKISYIHDSDSHDRTIQQIQQGFAREAVVPAPHPHRARVEPILRPHPRPADRRRAQ